MNILVIEDDEDTQTQIVEALSKQGHAVECSVDGRRGLALADAGNYDVIVVDRMLPGLDGLSVVKLLRDRGKTSPVLFVTNLDGIDDRVEGLNAGGDDYLVKPFAMAELLARVHALGRRPAGIETVLRIGDLELDLIRREVAREGRAIELQPREFKLLECLMRHAGRVLTRTMLLEMVWDFHFDPKTNIVETHVSRLRAKVDRGFESELIHTVRGSGYLLRAPA
ncbi:response regulator transcription factor [Bradyrhizobium diazoefficiens]|nr:response regulator transcription factor [Bradyrhizobium diazoefficiens]QQO19139.1 response regulator transcription factor [Bradyrhizobium diazoefficiens]